MADEIQKEDGSHDEQSRTSKRSRPVEVQIVERQGKSALVAWIDEGQYRRAFVPTSKLTGNEVDADVLGKCAPYGVDWVKKFGLPSADLLANELRRQGIWTAEDFKRGTASVRAAIMRIYVNPLVDKLIKEL